MHYEQEGGVREYEYQYEYSRSTPYEYNTLGGAVSNKTKQHCTWYSYSVYEYSNNMWKR